MLTTLLPTIGVLMALMAGWIEVQRAARRAAEQHPEAGPLRLIGGGCGGHGHGQENSGDAASVPKPLAVTRASNAAPAQGCATCANTACKPGALAAGSLEFHSLCSN
jgi:hypothetical protein